MALQSLNALKIVTSCNNAARMFFTSSATLADIAITSSSVMNSVLKTEPTKINNKIRPIMHKNWDWEFVAGEKPGRKPALQRPKAHQWYYCNPKYNPNDPLPQKIYFPHAPPTAESLDDTATFKKLCPKDPSEAKKFRKAFLKYVNQRNYDWKAAFDKGLEEEVKIAELAIRSQKEAQRQEAWNAYRAAYFENALKE